MKLVIQKVHGLIYDQHEVTLLESVRPLKPCTAVLNKTLKLYRSDNSEKFAIFKPRTSKYLKKHHEHNPAQFMSYLAGVFLSPQKEYAEAYPQPNIYTVKVSGKLLELPKDWDQIPESGDIGKLIDDLVKKGFVGVLGKKAANTSLGIFDEVVIFEPKKIKVIDMEEKL